MVTGTEFMSRIRANVNWTSFATQSTRKRTITDVTTIIAHIGRRRAGKPITRSRVINRVL